MSDRFELARFIEAQDAGGTYAQAMAELRDGRKVSHWMWFIFPQLAGLGRSATAQRYAISSLEEARAYLDHDVLGKRLRSAVEAVNEHRHLSAEMIFGSIDAMKLHSSMTLFVAALPEDTSSGFQEVLDHFFDGRSDPATMRLLSTAH